MMTEQVIHIIIKLVPLKMSYYRFLLPNINLYKTINSMSRMPQIGQKVN